MFKICGEDWQDDHRISLSGMNNEALSHYLSDNPQIDYLIFCLDNDKNATYANDSPAPNWGQVRAEKLHDEYSALGYNDIRKIRNYRSLKQSDIHAVVALEIEVKQDRTFRQHDKHRHGNFCSR